MTTCPRSPCMISRAATETYPETRAIVKLWRIYCKHKPNRGSTSLGTFRGGNITLRRLSLAAQYNPLEDSGFPPIQGGFICNSRHHVLRLYASSRVRTLAMAE